MLKTIGFNSLEAMSTSVVPTNIVDHRPSLALEPAMTESEALAHLKAMVGKNIVNKSYIGQGYYDTMTPNVILRNMLE
tara:strand:+ start:126 stop:359 length:234 start_codon:yes stop_codon:yes gene_type:complete